MIIATEENTTVNIIVADETYIRYNTAHHTAGKMLNINMNKFQTFHVYGGPDYTGTRITSNEPISVKSGASCTSIGLGACDHLSSQMTPVETFDNDGDGKIDEDLAKHLEEFQSTTTEFSTTELPTTEFLTIELPTTKLSTTCQKLQQDIIQQQHC
ncbi:unnamed protein product [Mytilus coruscus]|uniref:IgGFc-binding protein N-terminal domain-containing protein n=1 Tax=Mytilus coruscus TaxID=42192 RepID=A0A6J8BBI7_MYTCO|nr:unnamed protein product [Mytilus coruscus]